MLKSEKVLYCAAVAAAALVMAGYTLYPEDYGAELYRCETSMCVGPELAPEVDRALSSLIKEQGRGNGP